MEVAAQLLLNTLQIASVYLLFTLGLTLIFGVMNIVNFAHGEFFTFALITMYGTFLFVPQFTASVHLQYLIAAVAGFIATLILGYLTFQLIFKRFCNDVTGSFIVSVGLSFFLQGAFLHLFGGVPRRLPTFIEGKTVILGGAITNQRLILSVLAILIAAGAIGYMRTTRVGRSLRALAEDPEAAMLQGVSYRKTTTFGFMLAVTLAAAAGIMMSPVTIITPVSGNDYLILSFIAIVIGGLGSIAGSVLGSVIIALIESFIGYYFDATTATIIVFIVAMVILVWRPTGLLGR